MERQMQNLRRVQVTLRYPLGLCKAGEDLVKCLPTSSQNQNNAKTTFPSLFHPAAPSPGWSPRPQKCTVKKKSIPGVGGGKYPNIFNLKNSFTGRTVWRESPLDNIWAANPVALCPPPAQG